LPHLALVCLLLTLGSGSRAGSTGCARQGAVDAAGCGYFG
jgi:hypothetical protein